MKRKSTIIIFFILIVSVKSFSQNQGYDRLITTPFFKALKQDGLLRAMDVIFSQLNPAIAGKLKDSLKVQFDKIDLTFAFNNWSDICTRQLSEGLILESYLLKYDNAPYRLDILLYNKGNYKWCVQDLSVSTDLFLDLKNAGRAEKLYPNNSVNTF